MTLMNPNQPDFLSVVERQMQLTEAQGMAIRGLVDGIRQMQEDVAEKVGEVQMMVQEVRDSVTLTDAECNPNAKKKPLEVNRPYENSR